MSLTLPSTAAATAMSRIQDVAARAGERVESAGNRPIELDDTNSAWLVLDGIVDVFIFEQRDGVFTSGARHMLRAEAGRLLFGVDRAGTSLAAIAKGLPGAQLARLSLSELQSQDVADELAKQVDAWIVEFAGAVTEDINPKPRITHQVDGAGPRELPELAADSVLSARTGAVLWLDLDPGAASYLSTEEPAPGSSGLIPVTFNSWATLSRASTGQKTTSAQLAESGQLLQCLQEFHALSLAAEQLNRLLLLADVVNEQTARTQLRRLDSERARQGLLSLVDGQQQQSEADGDGTALMQAMAIIGRREGLTLSAPRQRGGSATAEPSLTDVLHASGVRARRVRLRPEDRWWVGDSGAMLGYLEENGRPVALLPHWSGSYRMIDPSNNRSLRINAARAGLLRADAWICYPTLPRDRPASALDLLRLSGQGMSSNFVRFAVAGLIAAVLVQAPAIALGVLTDWALSTGTSDMLLQVIAALAVFGLVGFLLEILQGTAMMRLEARAAARSGAAAWDRLLSMPAHFFRNYTAGELTARMSTFVILRDQLSGVVANALLSFVFLVPTLAILFIYDTALALVSVGMAVLLVVIAGALGLLQLGAQRRGFAAERQLTSGLLQFFGGISKLRGTGAEPSAFAHWARDYRDGHLAGIEIARWNEHLIAFSSALPAIVGALLFAVALSRGTDQLQVSDFLVVYAVSMTFFAAATNLGHAFKAVAAIVPSYEQVKPILEAQPEMGSGGSSSHEVGGSLRLDHVSFRYQPDVPLIDDVSIEARPGEFIAIVGESGAGKSTLLRLALGLEEPTGGSVYYDGRDLASLDRQELRRQLGVVMQDGNLQPGSLMDNIVGMDETLTVDDAWEAARMADVDEDIRQMPMQLFTVVGGGMATFSGGQTQRIRIAAALVRKPRIVLLDESTSWLDARSQAQVMQSIEGLAATRFVIAHRLSTIRNADRIYVLEAGRVVQAGSFDDLVAEDGPFRRLVERQIG